MEKEIRIENLTLTEKDIRASMFYAFKRRPLIRISFILSCFLIVLISFNTILSGDVNHILKPFVVFITMIVVIVASICFFANREYKTNKSSREKYSYTINDNSITVKSEFVESAVKWDIVYNITQNKHYCFIWMSQNSAYTIPKRFLTNADILFLDEIKQNNFCKEKN